MAMTIIQAPESGFIKSVTPVHMPYPFTSGFLSIVHPNGIEFFIGKGIPVRATTNVRPDCRAYATSYVERPAVQGASQPIYSRERRIHMFGRCVRYLIGGLDEIR